MRRICLAMLILLCVLILLPVIKQYAHFNVRYVTFEFVKEIDKRSNMEPIDYWIMINAPYYDMKLEYLTPYYSIKSEELDFNSYSYIITDRYSLVELSYHTNDICGRFSGSPAYYGYAILEESGRETAYLYRIPIELHITKDKSRFNEDYRTVIR